jgi:hypothetical protein
MSFTLGSHVSFNSKCISEALIFVVTLQVECVDIDECSEWSSTASRPPCGASGRCVNVVGGFECVCPDGFALSADGSDCIDMRKDLCYVAANCSSKAMSTSLTKVVCCCSVGKAWGRGAGCQLCPQQGKYTFLALLH